MRSPVDISSLPSKCFESETLSFELHATGFGFVQNEAFKRIKVARRRRLSQHLYRVGVARFPTEPNAIGTEVEWVPIRRRCRILAKLAEMLVIVQSKRIGGRQLELKPAS